MPQQVIDLSHHNTVPESLVPAMEAGIVGVIHKVTENTGFVDSKAKARRYLAQQAGMLWGTYHFIRPNNISQQVEFYYKQAMAISDKESLFCLDYEDSNVPIEDALQFMQELEDALGAKPIIYSGHVLKEKMKDSCKALTEYRLWLCQYGPTAKLPPGWDKYYLWQYTDKGEVAGINPPTDLNKFDGDFGELQATWAGRSGEPVTPEVFVNVYAPPGVKVIVNVNPAEDL